MKKPGVNRGDGYLFHKRSNTYRLANGTAGKTIGYTWNVDKEDRFLL